ncbi:GDSL esterase [Psilocybe cubensis]|uniref:GDSL esterase n=2 Tax=Psilocybe cubensis TaxID=181762 RepID=A0ACB8H8J6_PSICU|nr:GDSL esterase [Psilocybe cubensis]KAH9484034.1 GDSL esterase [Psilocybe cubensis]
MAAHVQDVFMLFGDSITQGAWEPGLNGFGQRLSHVYARKLDVLNRGLSGYNTEWGIPVFEQCIAKRSDENAPKLRVLAIWFGANDACILPSPQHVPLTKFSSNLNKMVDMVKSPESPRYSPDTRIILISPPPVNTLARRADLAARNPPLALDREFEITRAYSEAVREVANAQNVPFVDVWNAIWTAAGENEESLSKFLGDGLHLNEDGYKIVYNELMKTITEQCPEVHYDNLAYVFPPWAEIDLSEPAKSLYIM